MDVWFLPSKEPLPRGTTRAEACKSLHPRSSQRVGRALALLTRTYHGSRLSGKWLFRSERRTTLRHQANKVPFHCVRAPHSNSSGGRQRLGAISKQGNTMMRCLLVEAAQTSARLDPQFRRDYQRLKFRRGHSALAKVAMARRLAVRLYWKLREAAQPAPPARMQGSPASPVVGESLSSF
jgi:hypothetical protein